MTRDDFEHKLDNNPEDWKLRLIYADWLEEQGDNFAETQRWMAEHQKCAFQNKTVWHWWDEEICNYRASDLEARHLPGFLRNP